MRRLRRWAALGALAIGCAHQQPARVSDADFGRLSPEQTQPVDEARQAQQDAREELARAELGVDEARHELQMAKAEEAAADADAKRAKAVADAASDSREPDQLQRAAQLKEQARLHRASADAHVNWANKLIESRQAQVSAAKRQLDLSQAKVDEARLVALQQAGIPAATKYDAHGCQSRVQDAQKQVQDAQQKARKLDAEVASARQAYQDAHQQFQAQLGTPADGSPGQGTGSQSR